MRPVLANSVWFASCLPEAAAFWRATRDVAGTQRRVLRRITGYLSVEEFRERVPLSDEPGMPRELVIRHVPTSGTTGPTKLIPYTQSLLAEFQCGIAPWIADLFRHEPRMLPGKSYWSISPVAGEAEGFSDDTEYLGLAGRLARAAMAVPSAIRHIHDMGKWQRETVRHLMACRDLTFISVWHPSFLKLLLEGVDDPAKQWPRLRVISCWADAAAKRPAAELARLFPQARIQPKGLIATEGFVSVPLWGRDGAALAVRSHFFEFLADDGAPRLAHELAVGNEYSVVLTTSGGLSRYRLHDRVRITGFESECPLLRFVGKEGNVSDRFGEKINELQVASALKDLVADFALVACERSTYTLFVESQMPAAELWWWAERLETALLENVQYRYCRQLGQLEAVCVYRIWRDGAAVYQAACRSHGQRAGNVKPSWLSRDEGWSRVFEGEWLTPRDLFVLR